MMRLNASALLNAPTLGRFEWSLWEFPIPAVGCISGVCKNGPGYRCILVVGRSGHVRWDNEHIVCHRIRRKKTMAPSFGGCEFQDFCEISPETMSPFSCLVSP